MLKVVINGMSIVPVKDYCSPGMYSIEVIDFEDFRIKTQHAEVVFSYRNWCGNITLFTEDGNNRFLHRVDSKSGLWKEITKHIYIAKMTCTFLLNQEEN